MQQTKNYQLNIIESGDTFSPDPLNKNTEKLDAMLEQRNCKVYYTTYVGTGRKGPNIINFPSKPWFFLVQADGLSFWAGLRDTPLGFGQFSSIAQNFISLAWEDTSVAIGNSTQSGSDCGNNAGTTYHVIAFLDADD